MKKMIKNSEYKEPREHKECNKILQASQLKLVCLKLGIIWIQKSLIVQQA